MKYGFTCSSFDLLHAGHLLMLEDAKQQCDYLIVGLQTDPTIDRPDTKNKPVQSLIERQIQLLSCSFVDKIWVYQTEQELEELLSFMTIHVRIIGEEYRDRDFTGKDICLKRGIDIYYNKREHNFSSTELRNRIKNK